VGELAGRAVARQPKEIVARGYDAIALRYAEWAGRIDSPTLHWIRDLDARLADGSDVLELGCGRGVPVTRELARRHRVSGVDISAVHADASELVVAEGSLDAVVALFLFGHVPGDEQRELMTRIGLWLRPSGHLLATFGVGEPGEEVAEDWLGAPMFFASLGRDAYPVLVREAGLEIVRDEVVPQHEPGHGDVSFRWLLARAES
jgi:SAM-dependent methyltransferase